MFAPLDFSSFAGESLEANAYSNFPIKQLVEAYYGMIRRGLEKKRLQGVIKVNATTET